MYSILDGQHLNAGCLVAKLGSGSCEEIGTAVAAGPQLVSLQKGSAHSQPLGFTASVCRLMPAR